MIEGAPLWQERRLGTTLLRTRRATVDLDDIVPNDNRPKVGNGDDAELQRQIEANLGIIEPLLLEPHPSGDGRLRIIDGDRRWCSSRILVHELNKPLYRKVPADITDETLDDEEGLRVWIYFQRQRREWEAKEKEAVAHRLSERVGRASAANILDLKVREIDKLIEVHELATRLTNIRDPGATITWAREIKGINKNLMPPAVLDIVVEKVNEKIITNSKDVRRLRAILKDPVAKAQFLKKGASINDALEQLGVPKAPRKKGLAGDLTSLGDAIRRHPWTELAKLRGDADTLRVIDEVEKLLKDLRKNLKT